MAPLTTQPSTGPLPHILLLSLEYTEYIEEIYDGLYTKMSNQVTLKRAKKQSGALTYLSNNTPIAVLVTDAGAMKPENVNVMEKLKQYASNGGTVVFGCSCSSFMQFDMFDTFKNHFGLPWTKGDYHRTTVHLNQEAARNLPSSSSKLALSYSQKAVFLQNVAPSAALYFPADDSETESFVFPPTPVETDQTPVAWAKIGKGCLGYIGDVNGENGSHAVALAMCGLDVGAAH